jgi:hypothetical protein
MVYNSYQFLHGHAKLLAIKPSRVVGVHSLRHYDDALPTELEKKNSNYAFNCDLVFNYVNVSC